MTNTSIYYRDAKDNKGRGGGGEETENRGADMRKRYYAIQR